MPQVSFDVPVRAIDGFVRNNGWRDTVPNPANALPAMIPNPAHDPNADPPTEPTIPNPAYSPDATIPNPETKAQAFKRILAETIKANVRAYEATAAGDAARQAAATKVDNEVTVT